MEDALSMTSHSIYLTEAKFLGELVRELDSDGPIVEIGTYFAFSTRVIILHKEQDRELITIDNYLYNHANLSEEQHYRINKMGLRVAIDQMNVKLVKADKDEFCANYAGPKPALVFIDADHSYEGTKNDIEWARRVGAATICGHDYQANSPFADRKLIGSAGVTQAVDESGGPSRTVTTLWVL